MKNINKIITAINSKDDFICFVELLVNNLNNNPDEWTNKSLQSYLAAIASWTDDMEGFYINTGTETPKNIDWQFFATILIAAKIYE
jgi:hypothetical protein